jgi:DNA repair protein RecO (recombination protein O)
MLTLDGQALVIDVVPYGEGDTLVSLFCPVYGKIRGYVKGRKRAAKIQPMDEVRFEHTRRLAHQLGTFKLEVTVSRAVFWMDSAGGRGLLAVGWLRELLGAVVPEEQAYPQLASALHELLRLWPMNNPHAWRSVAWFERVLLNSIGYGLRLNDDPVPCAEDTALTYVSPTSGRAVSLATGAPYAARLLALPSLWGGPECASTTDAYRALTLCGFFLDKATYGAKLPARARLWAALIEQDSESVSDDSTVDTRRVVGGERV